MTPSVTAEAEQRWWCGTLTESQSKGCDQRYWRVTFCHHPIEHRAVCPNGSVVQVLSHIVWGLFSELFNICFSNLTLQYPAFFVGAEDCTATLYWLRQFSVPNCRSSYLINWPSYLALHRLLFGDFEYLQENGHRGSCSLSQHLGGGARRITCS